MAVNRKRSQARREAESYQRQVAKRIAEREAVIAEREANRQADQEAREGRIAERLASMLVDHEARKQLNSQLTRQRTFNLPDKDWTAEDFIAEDDSPLEAVIDKLHYRGNNTLLVAEYKTGKTTLEVNLAAALADGEPFLGEYETHLPHGKIALFNYEMDDRQFRHWLRDSGIKNPDRIVPLNLRGWTLPFWNEDEMLRLADWLLNAQVGFLIIDPAARAWRGLVEHEGDNVQLGEFFGALDELKRLADVSNLLIATHKPRANEDRARGGGEIEAWPDGNWYLNRDRKKGDLRSLRAEGRDIALSEIALEFNEDTRRLTVGGSMDVLTLKQDVLAVVSTVKAYGEVPSRTRLRELMKGLSSSRVDEAIEAAVNSGQLNTEKNGQATAYNVRPT